MENPLKIKKGLKRGFFETLKWATLPASLTLLLQLVNVPDDGPEEGSLLGVVVHAASHEFSQLLAVRGGQLALRLIEPLLLLRADAQKQMV